MLLSPAGRPSDGLLLTCHKARCGIFYRMSLYERFKDEADFRERFIKPLLNRLGFYNVSEQHGTQEFGKDFVFSELHRLAGTKHYAAQVKHKESINQGTPVIELLSQVRQAFATPFKRA